MGVFFAVKWRGSSSQKKRRPLVNPKVTTSAHPEGLDICLWREKTRSWRENTPKWWVFPVIWRVKFLSSPSGHTASLWWSDLELCGNRSQREWTWNVPVKWRDNPVIWAYFPVKNGSFPVTNKNLQKPSGLFPPKKANRDLCRKGKNPFSFFI